MKRLFQNLKKLFETMWARGALATLATLAGVVAAREFVWRYRVWVALLLVMCVFGAEFGLLRLPQAHAAYSISNSLRFNDDDSANLSRTFGTATDSKKWTYSLWVKRGNLGGGGMPLLCNATNSWCILFDGTSWASATDSFSIMKNDTVTNRVNTSALHRDPSAWIHLIVAVDTTQAVAANRVHMYVNGTEGAYQTTSYPTQNTTPGINDTSAHRIGSYGGGTDYFFDGYMSDIYFIDGQQLTPSSFAEVDSNGYWRAKAYSGTYGTNGFHLDFSNGSSLGTDVSGTGNNWTVNNMDATDQEVDTPTNFYPTFNSIWKDANATYSQGNLRTNSSGASIALTNFATMGMTTGKWYWEVSIDSQSNINSYLGIADSAQLTSDRTGYTARSWAFIPSTSGNCIAGANSCKVTNSSVTTYSGSYASLAATQQTYGFAFDADTGKLYVRDSTGWLASSDPAAGTSPMFSSIATTTPLFPTTTHDSVGSQSTQHTINFGQSKNATSTATTLTYNSAAGGYFLFTPPTGFKALSTSNMPEPTITVPRNYFDAAPYTGTGIPQQVVALPAARTAFGYTGSDQTFTVPSGVTSLRVKLWGAAGGSTTHTSPNSDYPGAGAFVIGTISVTPGQTLKVVVGQGGVVNGAGTTYGGGGASGGSGSGGSGSGGGYSGVFLTSVTQGNALAIAAGGGGSGNTQNNGLAAGKGGYASGGSGTGTFPGGGGTQSAGGTASGTATAGTALQGGNGAGTANNGGGGGGGYYGGGGGGDGSSNIGGGGGGSSFVGTMTATSTIDSSNGYSAPNTGDPDYPATGSIATGGTSGNTDGGNGYVVIYYQPTSATGFTPDLVWIKDRTTTNVHGIFDSVRSVIPYLSSNATTAETGGASSTVTSFLSNGFTLGANSLFNTSGNSYVSWAWKKSTTSGFDIVNYVGTGANRTISHSLGVTPDFMIIKDRGATNNWAVYHRSLTSSAYYLLMNSTAAQASGSTYWNSTAPTASVFSLGTSADTNYAGSNYTAYLFASTTGYSKFDSYTGNGAADGPFVYTGFKPRFVMMKRTDSTGNWSVVDNVRQGYNDTSGNPVSYANLSNADADTDTMEGQIDILSNGFKVRSNHSSFNASGATIVYAAFAEQPFQQSAQPYNLTIASSTRFISGSSDYLNRTPGSAGNRKTFTISFWTKVGALSTGDIFSAGTSNSDTGRIQLGWVGDVWQLDAFNWYVRTNAAYRDPSGWMHVVFAIDTTQATAANRIKLYINNVLQTYSTVSYPSQDTQLAWNDAVTHNIGRLAFTAGNYYDGYISDFYNVDGQQLDPSSFGEYDTNGYWRPKTYSGTYGTNGFHLPLMGTSTASGIGIDTSGNNNTWTVNNIATTDFVSDSPTNNFATMSPIDKGSSVTLTKGNLSFSYNAAVTERATFAIPSTGKWYWEVTKNGTNMMVGIANAAASLSQYLGQNANGWGYEQTGNKYNNGSGTAYGATYANGDVIGVAFDADAGTLTFYKNNSSQGTAFSGLTSGPYFPAEGESGASGGDFDFGQGGQSGLTYDSASGGYFKYTPPSGYKALSTANLPTPAVTVPKSYFNAQTYTGTGAAQSVTIGTTTAVSFTSSGTWTAPTGVTSVNYLVVAGGGGGGSASDVFGSGGGGAGGMATGTLSVTPGNSYTVTVGAGGAGGAANSNGSNGSNSVFGSITAAGGGGGATFHSSVAGSNGGSGGGGANNGTGTGGTGTAGQGKNGGTSTSGNGASGGGGAGVAGSAPAGGNNGAAGGDGAVSTILGYPITYAGGGGGGAWTTSTGGAGGAGGGGAGNSGSGGVAGAPNTGGGGGGGGNALAGGAGGSGVVIISYVLPSGTFQPSLVWIKDRTSANAHGLFDAQRTAYPYLSFDTTAAEVNTASTTLTAFLSNGFMLGTSTVFNTSGNNYISWLWKKCPAISSSCTAADGFDIVTYTGNGTNRTISHSLGAAPDFIMTKNRTTGGTTYGYWAVWHSAFAGTQGLLNDTGAKFTDATVWNSTAPTASVFSIGSHNIVNHNGDEMIAYLFKAITGFSNFGTYTGNGSADGPFVYTGFKPRYVMVKRTDSTGDWYIWDTARDTYNPATSYLLGNTTAADSSATNDMDILSNGFKLRVTTAAINASSGTFIYASFADVPFKYSAATAASVASTFVQAIAFLMGMTF